ncbi:MULTISPECIES: hypothetical protein [Clostridium]|mgnify:CR=1 FL=1|jgi:hypothetical protein|uniref:Chorion class high-cysteine HCB protein 13 n=3 Tax=Clostridium TaxID=1485 RepID=A0AAV3VW60_9CLOT|nr:MULTISPECIES: hypothetical protein [Clostridium]ABR33512.1 conserved hypothetical protein [Clostridium beijerinckii NCIMB 8052]AIU01035.1 hypothetical protein Cbs_1332 [Clostridium beijerinckii ATCC 35702]ALB47338.1 hypothetical protein X276_19835 [Clostridium beijerinckii NRRL B-598]AVK50384.1 hypothetical protein AXY43_21565 [Clostridium sp. MF28]MBE6086606.1 hypothetical protein [Clostridium beijerinckii]
MEMNDILNGLNSCDDDCSDSSSNNCGCGPNFGGPGIGGFPGGIGGCGQGFNNGGCGFNSWIWILLILFYCGCGRNNLGRGNVGSDCCCEKKCDCCCEKKDCCCNKGGANSGFLGSCAPYLFILVLLFLCNNNNGIGGGFNNCGFGGGVSPFGNNFGCAANC